MLHIGKVFVVYLYNLSFKISLNCNETKDLGDKMVGSAKVVPIFGISRQRARPHHNDYLWYAFVERTVETLIVENKSDFYCKHRNRRFEQI